MADEHCNPNVTLGTEHFHSDARNVTLLLDGIPGAFERAQLSWKGAQDGGTTALGELYVVDTSG